MFICVLGGIETKMREGGAKDGGDCNPVLRMQKQLNNQALVCSMEPSTPYTCYL